MEPVNIGTLESEIANTLQELLNALKHKVKEVEAITPESLLLGKFKSHRALEEKHIIFGKEVSDYAMTVLEGLIKQPLQNVAESCAKKGMNEKDIQAATTAAVKGILAGVNTLLDSTSLQNRI
ncbi:hypothetical protein [Xenorhabdus sp. SGI246]|uniref:hypothetical protein n=1 Tax=Xenorhabdus sp. SGI246 TaxID=3158263 RepID=UPI00349F6001